MIGVGLAAWRGFIVARLTESRVRAKRAVAVPLLFCLSRDCERCLPTFFGGRVFGRNLPRDLLAVPYAMSLRHCRHLTTEAALTG